MDLDKTFKAIMVIFKNGLSINFKQSITEDFISSLIFCITFAILILGFPNTFDGLSSWVFKTIYPLYSEMDLSHQFYFEHLIWAQVKISLFISIPIFFLTIVWSTIFYSAKKRTFFTENTSHLFLFTYRWVFAIQLTVMLLTPFLTIKILDMYQMVQTGTKINQLPLKIIIKEMLCLGFILLFFLFNFLYQAKKLLDLAHATPRRITKKFTSTAIIPIVLGITLSSFFHNIMQTDDSFNIGTFIYNQCVYMRKNPNIPGNNAYKATLQEVGCEKYTACFVMTDERLRNHCLARLYIKSLNFKFLVHNERRDICRN